MNHSLRRDFLRRTVTTVATATLALRYGPLLAAGTYPDHAVRLYVPFAPGAATDTLARFAAKAYTEALHQAFVVENRGGGATEIGTRDVAVAPADGYSIGMVDTTFVINPGLMGKQLPYNTLEDFAPISLMATAPFVMVVNPSVPASDLKSFIALAKSRPGRLTFGSAGVGSAPHLAGEQLREAANINVVHVPYTGGSTVFTDLLSGQISFAFGTVPTLLPFIKAGKVRAIAVTGDQRARQLPQVPSMAEAGYAKVDTQPLFGLIAPAKTPAAVIETLSTTIARAVQAGPLHQKLLELGFVPVGDSAAQFKQQIVAEVNKWTALIQKAHISAS